MVHDAVQCTSEATLETPSQCTPIHGFMTAQLSSQHQRQLALYKDMTPEQYLLQTIQSYITQNSTNYQTKDLLNITYIGQREMKLQNINPEVLARPISNGVEAQQAYPGSKYVGISVAGIFIAVLLVGLIYSYREDGNGRKKREEEEVEMVMEDLEVVEVKESVDSEDGQAVHGEVNHMDSMVASDGGSVPESPAKLLLNETTLSNESPSSMNPNIQPRDNSSVGLRGRVCSDESPVKMVKSDDASVEMDRFPVSSSNPEVQSNENESADSQQMEPMSSMEEDIPNNDDSVISPPIIADDDSVISPTKIADGENCDSDESFPAPDDTDWDGISNNGLNIDESNPVDANLSPSEATEKMSNTAPFIVENGSSDIDDDSESYEDEDDGDLEGVPKFV